MPEPIESVLPVAVHLPSDLDPQPHASDIVQLLNAALGSLQVKSASMLLSTTSAQSARGVTSTWVRGGMVDGLFLGKLSTAPNEAR